MRQNQDEVAPEDKKLNIRRWCRWPAHKAASAIPHRRVQNGMLSSGAPAARAIVVLCARPAAVFSAGLDAAAVCAGGVLPFAGDEFGLDKNLAPFSRHCSATPAKLLKMRMLRHPAATRLPRYPALSRCKDERGDAFGVASSGFRGRGPRLPINCTRLRSLDIVNPPSIPCRPAAVPSGAVEEDRSRDRPSPSAATGAGASEPRTLCVSKAGMRERDGDRTRPRLPEGTGTTTGSRSFCCVVCE